MSIQVYECPLHGSFDVTVLFKDKVRKDWPCPILSRRRATIPCNEVSLWRPSAPAVVIK